MSNIFNNNHISNILLILRFMHHIWFIYHHSRFIVEFTSSLAHVVYHHLCKLCNLITRIKFNMAMKCSLLFCVVLVVVGSFCEGAPSAAAIEKCQDSCYDTVDYQYDMDDAAYEIYGKALDDCFAKCENPPKPAKAAPVTHSVGNSGPLPSFCVGRTRNGKCYTESSGGARWNAAVKICATEYAAYKGRLAEVDAPWKLDFIRSLIKGYHYYWVGGKRVADSGPQQFQWETSGAPVAQDALWGPGKPSSPAGKCLELNRFFAYKFNDMGCWAGRYYICELTV